MKALQPGTVLKKRFEILQELGSGGMAVVYLANDQELNRKVAIKVLHLFMLSDEDSRVRFEREAQILSQLSNRHLPKLFSSGLLVDDVPYLVFEFVDGVSLNDEIKKTGGMPWKRALNIAVQIASSMQYVHEKGVVHRDLKPRNLMLSKDGDDFVKVLDFGLAKALSLSIGSTITSTGALIGTPQYMSPEQCKGVACDEAADIYALGCIIYEMLTGSPPFNSTEFVSLIRKHEKEQPELISKKAQAADLPKSIDAVVLKALEKEPEKRYRSMSQFSEALEKCLQGATQEFDAREVTALSVPKEKSRHHLVLIVFLALTSIGVFAFLQYRNKQDVSAKLGALSSPADRLLRDFDRKCVLSKGMEKNAVYVRNQYELAQDLLVREIQSPRDHAAYFSREFLAMKKLAGLAEVYFKIDPVTPVQSIKLINRATEQEHLKKNYYNQGELLLLEAMIQPAFKRSTTSTLCKSAWMFSKSADKERSDEVLQLARNSFGDQKSESFQLLYVQTIELAIKSSTLSDSELKAACKKLYTRIQSFQKTLLVEYAQLIATLASICQERGLYQDAEYYYIEANRGFNPAVPSYATGLKGLAEVQEKQGKYEAAIETFGHLRRMALEHTGGASFGPELEYYNMEIARLTEVAKKKN